MADNISIYNGTPTAGAMDGSLVTVNNPITDGDLQIGADREGTPIKLAVRAVNAKKRTGSFPIQVSGGSADCWNLAPDSNGSPGAWAGWGQTLNLVGPINARNTIFWANPRVKAAEAITPAGALTMDDATVTFRIPTDVVDDVFTDTQPVFSTGPVLTGGDGQLHLEAVWASGGDGEAVTAKAIVKANTTAPTTSDWNAAAAFDGDEWYVGTNGVAAYAWVQLTDATGNKVVSQMQTATPSSAINLPPTFGAGPSVTGITQTGATVTATYTDPEGDGITATYRVMARGATPNWTGAPAFASPQTVGSLTAGTQYDLYVRLSDTHGNVVTSSAVQFTTSAANVAPTFSTASTVSGISQSAATVTAAATDTDGDTLTYKVAVTTSATPPADWSGYADRTHATMAAGVSISGLAAGTAYYAHVRVDDAHSHLVISTSAQFTTTAATLKLNDFAAGQALDTTWLGTSVANSGSAATTTSPNRLKVTSYGSDNRGALWFGKTATGFATPERITVKFTPEALASGWVAESTMAVLGNWKTNAGDPQCGDSGTGVPVNPNVLMMARAWVYYGWSPANLYLSISNGTNFYDFTTHTFTNSDGAMTTAGKLLAAGTYYQLAMETRDNAGAKEVRFILSDAAGTTTLETTPWTQAHAAGLAPVNSCQPFGGDPYTNAYQSSLGIAFIKRENI